jgi:hypothetical protein
MLRLVIVDVDGARLSLVSCVKVDAGCGLEGVAGVVNGGCGGCE